MNTFGTIGWSSASTKLHIEDTPGQVSSVGVPSKLYI